MIEGTTTVAGIQIPSADPVFLSVVAIHIPLGLCCVVSGAVAVLSTKVAGRHTTAGTIYYWATAATFASATLLSAMRWAEDYHLFLLSALAFATVHLGRMARRGRWRGWTRLHIASMGCSYVVLLTAFYVDNGKQLPLWRDLPVWTYWILPALIGAPVIGWALLRHPLVQQTHAAKRNV
ncbi:MAG: DUF2306 domain-containing protein [Steroidobacteraceae bacterium]